MAGGGIGSGTTAIAAPVTTYEKVSEDVGRKTVVEEIDIKALKEELTTLDTQLSEATKLPDEITVKNIYKQDVLLRFQNRKEVIEKLLGLIK